MRSKVFWLAVLALVILVAIISCYAPRIPRDANMGIIPPLAPNYEPYESPPYQYEYEYEEPEAPEPEEPTPHDPGELDLESNAAFVAGRYAGFVTWGYFRHSSVEEDVIVAESLVMDTQTNQALKIEDIFDMEMIDKALYLLAEAILAHAPQAAPYLHMIETGWLTHFLIDHEGIGVLLPPDIAPWDLGFMYVLIPYEGLGDAFLLGVELGLREPPPRRLVALTFDDGPSEYTAMILDILEEYGVRATFCVLGYRIQRHPEALVRAVAMGSEVIGHSWNHSNFTQLSAAAIANQINRTTAEIESVIGQSPPPIMRVPFGIYNNNTIRAVRDLGYSLLHWSVDPRDWYNRDADMIYNNIMARVTEGSIVLLHDIRYYTVEAMRMLIPQLIEDGFQLVTATELIAYHYGELEPGEVYQGYRSINW